MRDASAPRRRPETRAVNGSLFSMGLSTMGYLRRGYLRWGYASAVARSRGGASSRSSRRLRSGFAFPETTLHVYDSLRQRVHEPHGALARRAHVVIAQAIDPVQVHQRPLERVAQKP